LEEGVGGGNLEPFLINSVNQLNYVGEEKILELVGPVLMESIVV